ncbi:GAF domain-containing protein, partial [Nostoc sp. NIES-2111]
MLSSPDLSFSRNLPLVVFNQLGELLQQMAQSLETSTLLLTEALLSRVRAPKEWQSQRFTLLVSERFSALLLGNWEQTEVESQAWVVAMPPSTNPNVTGMRANQEEEVYSSINTPPWLNTALTQVNASLTFNSEAIASFMSKLRDLFRHDSYTHQHLERYRQILKPNDATLQSQFTLLLLEHLLPKQPQEVTDSPSVNNRQEVYACQAVEDALKKQISQERLLNQVNTQIRKSLDLPVIMATAIAQVREFLELDRLVIYKFEAAKVNGQSTSSQTPDWQKYEGCIVYEALATEAIPSVLHYQEQTCFGRNSSCWEKYRQGFTLVIDDVEKAYALEECLLNFLRESQVRAKLAAPIIFEDKLWGLLIAHQCYNPRQWAESEKNLLISVAEQLAIAIHQAELMRSLRDAARTLTQEKQTLEQRVIERTMALRDALLAAEAANRLRSEFLATISHELLTPLTYVIGMSSTLLRWPIGELSQRQRDYLQTIHDSG